MHFKKGISGAASLEGNLVIPGILAKARALWMQFRLWEPVSPAFARMRTRCCGGTNALRCTDGGGQRLGTTSVSSVREGQGQAAVPPRGGMRPEQKEDRRSRL